MTREVGVMVHQQQFFTFIRLISWRRTFSRKVWIIAIIILDEKRNTEESYRISSLISLHIIHRKKSDHFLGGTVHKLHIARKHAQRIRISCLRACFARWVWKKIFASGIISIVQNRHVISFACEWPSENSVPSSNVRIFALCVANSFI